MILGMVKGINVNHLHNQIHQRPIGALMQPLAWVPKKNGGMLGVKANGSPNTRATDLSVFGEWSCGRHQ